MVSDRAFIFHVYMYFPWGKTLSLEVKPRSSVKVKYQGHSFRKNGCFWDIHVSQTHLFFFFFRSTGGSEETAVDLHMCHLVSSMHCLLNRLTV